MLAGDDSLVTFLNLDTMMFNGTHKIDFSDAIEADCDIYDIQLLEGSLSDGLKKNFIFMTNQGVYRGSITKQIIANNCKFLVEIDPKFSCFPGRHVSSLVQLATSTGHKLFFTVNDFRSIYMLFDL